MKSIALSVFVVFFLSAASLAQDSAKIAGLTSQLAYNGEGDVLKEADDIKKLVIKYADASAEQKPALKKEIEKLQLKKEEEAIKKEEVRVLRQEAKIQDIKASIEKRKKDKVKTAAKKTDSLLTPQSISKIREQQASETIKDKVKAKAKAKS